MKSFIKDKFYEEKQKSRVDEFINSVLISQDWLNTYRYPMTNSIIKIYDS